MKYLCLGYIDRDLWEALSHSEQDSFVDACAVYDESLRMNGHMLAGESMSSIAAGATLRLVHGEVSISDRPCPDAKRQLSGVLMLEAKDLNHAIQLISHHPGIRLGGCFEVLPTNQFS